MAVQTATRDSVRESRFRWTLNIGGIDCGPCKTFDGGDKDSDGGKVRPAAGESEDDLGGNSTYDNIVLEQVYDALRHPALEVKLDPLVGNAPYTAVRQLLDRDGIAMGQPRTYAGTFKKFTPPKADSEGTDAAMVTYECSVISVV